MSVDFIKKQHNAHSLSVAQRQQAQLSYFTKSEVQREVTAEYIQEWAKRKYAGADYFLTWVKMIFRSENFLSFYKYLRFPLASARLINDEIKPQLRRVFTSEDGYFKYVLGKKEIETPEQLQDKWFNEELFNAVLFCHNDIVFVDLKDVNTPFRQFVDINNVVAIDVEGESISRIAFKAETETEGGSVYGYLYADDTEYIFYDRSYNVIVQASHDLGVCPADFIGHEAMDREGIVRKSIFTYVREELEEYVFLKTLLKMTEPNGAIPVVTKLKTTEVTKEGKDLKGSPLEPMSSNAIGGQISRLGTQVAGGNSPLQAGTIIDVPPVKDAQGNVDMDVVQNFLKFFYIPVESLKYINDRITEVKKSIITAIVGDYTEQNQEAVNELQISRSYVNRQDKLRQLSRIMSKVRTASDYKMLALQYGKDRVGVECFYGSDFFLETQADLFDLFAKSPNQIESRNILLRLSQNRNRYSPERMTREKILYNLLPFASNTDFSTAVAQKIVDPAIMKLQLQFNYWIAMFEAEYGDIVTFWDSTDDKDSVKIKLINELIKTIINEQESNSTPAGVQGQENVL